MNTTAAAAQANVTVATIRNWCRNGVVAATKAAGRWFINQASLTARMAISAMKAGGRLVHYRCHTITAPGTQGITRVDGLCPTCQKAQQERATQTAARGPLATRPQVSYLMHLIGSGANRTTLETLSRADASSMIDRLKAGSAKRCSCASARHSGICTCG